MTGLQFSESGAREISVRYSSPSGNLDHAQHRADHLGHDRMQNGWNHDPDYRVGQHDGGYDEEEPRPGRQIVEGFHGILCCKGTKSTGDKFPNLRSGVPNFLYLKDVSEALLLQKKFTNQPHVAKWIDNRPL